MLGRRSARPADGRQETARGRAGRKRGERPFGPGPVDATEVIDLRQVAGAGLDEREDRGDQDEVGPDSPPSTPRAVLQMNAMDGGQHRRGQHGSGERSGESGARAAPPPASAAPAAIAFALPGGPHTPSSKAAGGRLETVSLEPAEQLLRAVADEQTTDGRPQE